MTPDVFPENIIRLRIFLYYIFSDTKELKKSLKDIIEAGEAADSRPKRDLTEDEQPSDDTTNTNIPPNVKNQEVNSIRKKEPANKETIQSTLRLKNNKEEV